MPGKVGTEAALGSLPNTPSRFPLTLSLPLVLSACLCALTSLPPTASSLCPVPHPARLSSLPQQSLKADPRPLEGSATQLPILADMLLYYCRFAARPVLLQVYQTEVRRVCRPVPPRLPGSRGHHGQVPGRGPAGPAAPRPHPEKPPG